MPDRSRFTSLFWAALTVASLCVAGYVAIDTTRTIVLLHSALPWFDDWNSFNLYRDWSDGSLSAIEALSSQFGEHRLLVPRLFFLVDDLYLHGQGWLELAAILLVQAGHAALFAVVLAKAAPRGAGRWAVAGSIVALMFSLKQATNFASSFQLQFVGVFAAATLAFVLFGRVVAQAEAGLPTGASLAGSLAAAAVSAFCMANGLIGGLVLVVLALAARLRARIVAICGLAWLVVALLYADGYHAAPGHAPLSDALRRPVALAFYAATYLGNLAGEANVHGAAALGFLGMIATAAAAVLVVRRRVEPCAGFALLGVMLFCGASALVTGLGRLNFGIDHALEQRYVTGSVTFWSVQLCFWWIAAPARLPRAALVVVGAWLAAVLVDAQSIAKPALYIQRFDQDDAADLLLLGLHDPATIRRAAWDADDVRDNVPIMRDAKISIFGGPDAALFGHPLGDSGRIAAPDTCSGTIGAAVSDPRLGREGVRVDGQGSNEARHRRLRRVLLVDRSDTIVGLAVSGNPAAKPGEWQGFAVAPVGTALAAYGVLDADNLCRLGEPRIVAGE